MAFGPNKSGIRDGVLPALLMAAALSLPSGQPDARGQESHAYTIQPTVTEKMGDKGGKYFGQPPDPAKTRHYYIAAEPDQWDFMPAGSDPVCGMTPSRAILAEHLVRKVRYFQYTDGTFTERMPQTPRLGILGPVLRGVVGDYMEITFLNRTALPLSMHPHGVKYDKDSEGSYYTDNDPSQSLQRSKPDHFAPGLGAAVGPFARFTYVWYLVEKSGPLPTEPISNCWLYHSHVGGEVVMNLGLEGFIIVTDPKRARPDGTPDDVDREMPALFMIFNQGHTDPEEAEEQAKAARSGRPLDAGVISSLAIVNGNQPSGAPGLGQTNAADSAADLQEASERHTINGYIYGNLPGLEMNEGERVRWYLFGLGSESDLHTPHWHGLRVMEEGVRRTDTIELLPGSMKVADMLADNPGNWLFHCHVADHMANGMFALVTVYPRDNPGASVSPAKSFLGFPPPRLSNVQTNGN